MTDGAATGPSAMPAPILAGRFDGKAVLVTGGSGGIGFAAASRMAREGATVFITGRREAELEAARERIGERAVAIAGDVTRAEDLARLFEVVAARTGRLDALVANAGGGGFAAFGDYTPELVNQRFDLNVNATVFTVQGAVPLMPPGGSIVLVGSIAGLTGMAGLAIYGASKAAVRSLARTWSVDLKERGLRVNVVSPGVVYTEVYGAMGIARESYDPTLPTIPLGRIGDAEDLAGPIAFLASEDSRWMTGTEMVVDGGQTQV